MRTLRIRGWLLIAGCFAVTAVVYCTIHIRSRAPASTQAVASAEDEVYVDVVLNLLPANRQAHSSQFDAARPASATQVRAGVTSPSSAFL